MFLGFVHSFRIAPAAAALAAGLPQIWQTSLFPATGAGRSRRPPHVPELDLDLIRGKMSASDKTCAVLFALDLNAEQVAALGQVVYALPMLEVVSVRTKGRPAESLQPLLEYYGLVEAEFPADLPEALSTLERRYPDVVVLKRASKSAAAACDFKKPRLALNGMHVLRRIVLEWAQAKEADPKRVQHRLMKCPTREALQSLMQDAQVDLSDAADKARKRRRWLCDDGEKRYFGWHLKVSVAGPKSTENHCRIHYCVDPEKGVGERMIIGHCGEHLD